MWGSRKINDSCYFRVWRNHFNTLEANILLKINFHGRLENKDDNNLFSKINFDTYNKMIV